MSPYFRAFLLLTLGLIGAAYHVAYGGELGRIVLLKLTINASTGEPLKIEAVGQPYVTREQCEDARAAFGPQKPLGDQAVVYACAVPKDITVL